MQTWSKVSSVKRAVKGVDAHVKVSWPMHAHITVLLEKVTQWKDWWCISWWAYCHLHSVIVRRVEGNLLTLGPVGWAHILERIHPETSGDSVAFRWLLGQEHWLSMKIDFILNFWTCLNIRHNQVHQSQENQWGHHCWILVLMISQIWFLFNNSFWLSMNLFMSLGNKESQRLTVQLKSKKPEGVWASRTGCIRPSFGIGLPVQQDQDIHPWCIGSTVLVSLQVSRDSISVGHGPPC